MAGKSTLNRLELSRPLPTRYHKISHDAAMIERAARRPVPRGASRPPKQIILDLDATDDPLHGHQEGRFFHGYYDCYCYLPLYVFCGRHLLAAKLRKADIDARAGAVEEIARIVAQIRARWPHARILLRADSGFAREELMAWCEANRVDYLFGLARNARLAAMIESELPRPRRGGGERKAGAPLQGVLVDDAGQLVARAARRRQGGMDARRGQPALRRHFAQSERPSARRLYEKVYCARGDMENRIKECQPTCSPTAPRPRPCAPISCGCGLPRSPTCSCAPCAASASSTRSSPRPIAPPSVSSCSRSARSCESRSAASSSPWPHPSPTRANSGSPTSGSPQRRSDEPDSAQST